MFNRQKEDLLLSAPVTKLGAIRVLLPANTAQQFPIGATKSDEVTATAMIGAENQLLRPQLRETSLDVARAQPRAISPDRDDFVIAKLRNSLDCVFKACGKTATNLTMNVGIGYV